MSVAHDASSNYGASTANVSSFSWTHTPSGTPRAAIVFVSDAGAFSSSSTVVSSVTYGGTSMTKLPYYARDPDIEIGNVTAWFLDNVSSGAQTVVVNRTSNNVAVTAGCATVTASGACEVVSSRIRTQSGSGSVVTGGSSATGGVSSSWNSISVDDGSPGSNSQRYVSIYTGASSVPGAGTNASTTGIEWDWGNYCWQVLRETTPSQGSKTLSTSASISDDLAVLAFAVSETSSVTTQNGSFTSSAAILRGQSGGLSGAAVIRRAQSGSSPADAVVLAPVQNALSADAALFAGIEASFTAAASLAAPGAGALAADAVLLAVAEDSFTADAWISSAVEGGFTTSAVMLRQASGQVDADSIVRASASSSLTADALLLRGSGTKTLAADAEIVSAATPDIAVTARGVGGNGIADTSWTLSPSSNLATGALAVLVLAYDNTGSTGVDPGATITDSHGNTWTARHVTLRDPSVVAGAGAVLRIATTDMSAGTLTTSSVITVTHGNLTQSKAWVLWEAASQTGGTVSYLATGTGAQSASTTPSVTTGTITVNDAVIGGVAYEYGAAVSTADSDTTNGSWSSAQSTYGGPAASVNGMSVCSQYKVQATTGSTQTYNVTYGTSSDWAAGWISVRSTGGAEYGSFTANAVLAGTGSGSLAASAVIRETQPGFFDADAEISVIGVQHGSFTSDAVVLRSGVGQSFAAASAAIASISGSIPAGAWLLSTSSGSFTVDASVFMPVLTSFTADAILVPVGAPPIGRVSVWIDGVDFTDHVIWATASFTAKVNGAVGDCLLQIRDDNHAFTFTFGQEVYLNIDGVIRWGGWIMRPQRSFPMAVVTDPLHTPRIWTLEGVDFNLIFDKRVIHDLDKPERVWKYAPGTYDDTIIKDVWKYLDMEGFTKDIDRVAVAILDIAGVTSRSNGGDVASGGFTFRDVMSSIIRNTAAIYYCSPTKVITYVDSDKVNSPHVLTDKPYPYSSYTPPANAVPYRMVKIREDNSNMVNDALVWGAGYGSQNVVFARSQAPVSRNDHGRWQVGQSVNGVYKQATVNALADSYVEGSPSAHRAQKHPKWSVELVTQSTALNIGDVVEFQNSSFDLTDMPNPLPVRSQTITFPTPDDPRFALTLSWEIDAAWSFQDPWKPEPAKDAPCDGCGGGGGGGGDGDCDDTVCGITDSFNRTVASGWGTSDYGIAWEGGGGYVTPSTGARIASGVPSFTYHWIDLPRRVASEYTYEVTEFSSGSGTNTPAVLHSTVFGNDWAREVYIGINSSLDGYLVVNGAGGGNDTATLSFTPDVPHKWHVLIDATTVHANVWPLTGTEPAGWMLEGAHTAPDPYIYDISLGVQGGSVGDPAYASFRNLDVVGVNRCSAVQFDDFNRTVASGWGTATPSGYVYGLNSGAYGTGAWVSGGVGHTRFDGSAGAEPYATDVSEMATLPYELRFDHTGWGWLGLTVLPLGWGTAQLVQIGFDPVNPQSGMYINYNYVGGGTWTYSYGDHGEPVLDVLPGYASDYSDIDQPHTVKVRVEPRILRLKAWKTGTAEPDWMMTANMEDPGGDGSYPAFDASQTFAGNDTLWFGTWSGQSDTTWDNIDISYGGKPCYPCMLDITDSFSRTVAGGWGTSEAGIAWGTYDDGHPGATYDHSVSSGVGSMSLSDGGDNIYADLPFSHEQSFAVAFDFTLSATGLGNGASMSWQIGSGVTPRYVVLAHGTALGTGWWLALCHLFPSSSGSNAQLDISSWFTPGTAYRLRWECEAGVSQRVRIWEASAAEPAEWTLTDDLSSASAMGVWGLSLDLDSNAGSGDLTLTMDNLGIGKPCQPVVPSAAGSDSIGEKACDELVPLSGQPYPAGTQWKTTQASYIPGSTKLAVNGIFRFGEYTETDPANGIITANIYISSTDVVTLCYLTNGPLP